MLVKGDGALLACGGGVGAVQREVQGRGRGDAVSGAREVQGWCKGKIWGRGRGNAENGEREAQAWCRQGCRSEAGSPADCGRVDAGRGGGQRQGWCRETGWGAAAGAQGRHRGDAGAEIGEGPVQRRCRV